VVLAVCCLVLLAAVTAPTWAPELWPGKGTQHLSFEESLQLVLSPDVREGNRANGAGRLAVLVQRAIYEMRLTAEDSNTPEHLRKVLGGLLSRIEKMPSEPIPQEWLDRR
jgi:hypothetical protein